MEGDAEFESKDLDIESKTGTAETLKRESLQTLAC